MIKLASFIDAIHDAVLKANDTLTDSHTGILTKFFKKTPPSPEGEETYEAETIALKYPHPSENGIEERDIDVPLLTMAPISCPTIDNVEFTSRFEVTIMEDTLSLDFAKDNKDTTESKSNRSGQLSVKISPQEVPEGLKAIIEGYERVLKSQIG